MCSRDRTATKRSLEADASSAGEEDEQPEKEADPETVPDLSAAAALALEASAKVVARIGVNLSDGAESDLRTASNGERPSNTTNADTLTKANWLEALLAIGALACLLADGFVLGGHKLGQDRDPAGDLIEPGGAQ
jgi:hypothetical protein